MLTNSLAGRVIENVGGHRVHHGDVIGNAGDVRQALRHPRAGGAVTGELAARAQHLRRRLGERVHEGEALALDEFGGNRLAVQLGQLRLVVEQLQLTRRTGHEQEDDVLGLGGEVRLLRGQRVGEGPVIRRRAAFVQERRQRGGAEADAALAEEMAAGLQEEGIHR